MPKTSLLLVENDAFLASIYAKAFEARGFEAMVVGSGEDGIRLAKREMPAAILLEILLPGMDGFETLEALQADAETRGIPVIILSDMSQREDVERAMALGASCYLIKAHTLPADAIRKVEAVIRPI